MMPVPRIKRIDQILLAYWFDELGLDLYASGLVFIGHASCIHEFAGIYSGGLLMRSPDAQSV